MDTDHHDNTGDHHDTSPERRTTAADVLAGVDLTGRRYLVTGGGSGLGLASVEALVGAGAAVIIATRDPSNVDALARSGDVDVRQLDLADLDSVRSFVRAWDRPLDGLIANAGVMALPERRLSASGWEMQLATNHLGHFALALGLHEHLVAAGDARIVVVSSGAQLLAPLDLDDPHFARRPYDPWVAYAQSKTADVLMAVGMARRWAGDGITANAVAPGWIRTRLQRHVDPVSLRSMGVYEEDGKVHTPAFFKTTAQGAADQVSLVAAPATAHVTGRYFEDGRPAAVVEGGTGLQSGVASWSIDPDTADGLWELGLAAIE
ncbi:SDR family NAD(P)-dependent oxidoreductase [Curtobacterium sp. MCBD17_030]|uniref:SDR family NAD(P)-dependent oxidoreductase n=1 Tax=Curtobacterium sp. MCBD17_030 TaxID=2175649 RepID=UPI000D84FD1A|nr:SDR family NAD(P)-dependent oxidoreductase [Curtobacterium sp. MCBD17_030]PYY33684.1 oxidoreductase [Curtobacterium sp. MCBD17_030]